VELAQEARRKGFWRLKTSEGYSRCVLVNSVMLIVDAIEPEKAREILKVNE
jgi:flagellar motor component MotA